jgi:Ternary complex associated domain 9
MATKISEFIELPAGSEECLGTFSNVEHIQAIDRLRPGFSGAQVWRVRFRITQQSADRSGVLKLGESASIERECQNHRDAWTSTQRPAMPQLFGESETVNGWKALLFSVAHGSFLNTQDLAARAGLQDAAAVTAAVVQTLCRWYETGTSQTQSTLRFIRDPFRVRGRGSGLGQLARCLSSELGIQHTAGQIRFTGGKDGRTYPNPIQILEEDAMAAGKRFSAPVGPVHGDLNSRNVMVELGPRPSPMLIDLAHYRQEGSPLHDLAFLQLDLAESLIDLTKVPLKEWEQLWSVDPFMEESPMEWGHQVAANWRILREISKGLEILSGSDTGIRDYYRVAYLHALVSAGLKWASFSAEPAVKRSGALLVAAEALGRLESMECALRTSRLASVRWRAEQPGLAELEDWFSSGAAQAIREGAILVIGPRLVEELTGLTEKTLAEDLARVEGGHPRWRGDCHYDPKWQETVPERSRASLCNYLATCQANGELVDCLTRVPWLAVFDWGQVPAIYKRFRATVSSHRRVIPLMPGQRSTENDRVGHERMLWVFLRGNPEPPDAMVWGEQWVDELSRWQVRLGAWHSQLTKTPLIVGLGLDDPMKEDVWKLLTDIFHAGAQLANVAKPVSAGRPVARSSTRNMKDLEFEPSRWVKSLCDNFPELKEPPADNAGRKIVFRPLGEQESQTLTHLVLDADVFSALSEYVDIVVENTGLGDLPEGRALSDFVYGYPVLWHHVRARLPILRLVASHLTNNVLPQELDLGNPRRVHIHHEPGAGGSLIARQAAWECYHNLHVPAMVLRKWSDTAVEQLRSFWYRINRSFLVVVEEEVCSVDQWETVHATFVREHIPVVSLLVTRHSPTWLRAQRDRQSDDIRRIFVSDELLPDEENDLRSKLASLVGNKRMQRLPKEAIGSLFAVLFTLFEGDYSRHQQIVRDLLNSATKEAAELLRVLSFFRRYPDLPWVPEDLLKQLADSSSPLPLTVILQDFLNRLILYQIIGHSHSYAIRHDILAEDILAVLLGSRSERSA